MYTPNTESNPSEVGVADYFDNHPEETASILVAKAPDVLILARCIGAPKTARYFAKRLECKVTEKMIKTIKAKVAKDIILVTREELVAAALSHPITAARMTREPSLCDPQHYRAVITSVSKQEEIDLKIAKEAGTKKEASRRSAEKIITKQPANEPAQARKKAAGAMAKEPIATPPESESGEPNSVGKESNAKKAYPTTGSFDKSNAEHLSQAAIDKVSELLDADDEADAELYS